MSRLQHRVLMVLGAICLLAAITAIALAGLNRRLQTEVAQRQQYVQQSVQLEGLYREIVRALAELAARHNDEDVRRMLGRHGITYTVTPPPATDGPAQGQGGRK